MPGPVTETAERIPTEIRAAISGFDNETTQAVVVTLIDEEALAFSEIQDHLSTDDDELHSQTLTNALRDLQRGELVNKRAATDDGNRISSYYEVTEYGERFVDCLLKSLGSVDSFEERAYESVEHYRTQSQGESIRIEAYHRGEDTRRPEERNPPAHQ